MERNRHINERIIDNIIKEEINRAIHGKSLVTEMAMPRKMFVSSLSSEIYNAFTNIACICIFHDVTTYPINHWAERATEPFIGWYTQEITNETDKKRKKAVEEAFNLKFNEGYTAINAESYDNLITYYKSVPKLDKIIASHDSQFYYDAYNQEIIGLLNIFKKSLYERNYKAWVTAVSDLVSKYCKDE